MRNEIWERQRHPETGRLEPIKAYRYFNEYLLMSHPRSLTKLCEIVGKDSGYVRQLEKYSSTWNWIKRCEAYDEFIILKKRASKEKFFDELVESELPNLRKRLSYYNKNLTDIEKDENSRPTTKATAFEKNSKAHSTTWNELLLILGKPTEIKETAVDAEVRADAEVQNHTQVNLDLTSDEFMENELEFMKKLIERREE